MIDAYCHLDLETQSPLADIEQKLASARLSGAFLVETWDGRNRPVLEDVLRREQLQQFYVALCYRKNSNGDLLRMARTNRIAGIRMSSENLRADQSFCGKIADLRLMLVAHAENGIASLAREIMRVQLACPHISIYIPHLGWPTADGKLCDDWEPAVKQLASMQSTIFGISAISHFSTEPFPHEDIRDLALKLISQLPSSRIVIGSDYPLCAKNRYADYIDLAHEWVTSIHPTWAMRGFPTGFSATSTLNISNQNSEIA